MSEDDAFNTNTPSNTAGSSAPRSGRLSCLPIALAVGVLFVSVIATLVFFYVRAQHRHTIRVGLLSFGLRYSEYHLVHGHFPSSLDELEADISDPFGVNEPPDVDDSLAYEMVRDGRFVVIWNATTTLAGTPEGADYVLGYESDVSERGGFVMLGDLSVHYMSAADFGRLPKIGTTDLQADDSS